jgi:hypothetical protein
MRLQKMRYASGCYLMVLGTLEIVLWLLRDSVPFILRPHAPLLWLTYFVESDLRSNIASLSICILVVSGGIAMFTNRKRLAIPYCIAGGLISIVDLHLPLAIMISGGSHVVTFGEAALVCLAVMLYDVIPVSLTVFTVTRPK